MCPDMRMPFQTRAGQADWPMEPGLRMLCDPWLTGPRPKLWRFAGTVKRHNFGRGPVSHGSHNIRKPGSIGQSAWPARVWKGIRMSGHMGAETVTQRGLVVVDADPARNLLLVSGSVPGAPGSLVYVREDR